MKKKTRKETDSQEQVKDTFKPKPKVNSYTVKPRNLYEPVKLRIPEALISFTRTTESTYTGSNVATQIEYEQQQQKQEQHADTVRKSNKGNQKPSTKDLIAEAAKREALEDPPIKLSLEAFDNSEYEDHTPEEWIAIGKNTNGTDAKSRFFNGKDYEWAPCKVVEYDATLNSFKIIWEETKKEKMVKRLNILFDLEDENKFFKRLEFANNLRASVTKYLRYLQVVDKVPDQHITPMSEDQVDTILKLVASEFPTAYLQVIEDYMTDMRHNYYRGIKEGVFDYYSQDASFFDNFREFDLPPLKTKPKVPELGVVEVPNYNYERIKKSLISRTFHSTPLVIQSLVSLQRVWTLYSSQSLIDTELYSLDLPCSLASFAVLQSETTQKFVEQLKDSWVEKVARMIETDVEIDEFNIYVNDLKVFESGVMKRIYTLVCLIMSSQLRTKMEEDIKKYVDLVESYSLKDEKSCDPLKLNGKTPLFLISIIADGDHCRFEPPLDQVLETVRDVFEFAFKSTDSIPTIASSLFQMLHMDEQHYLTTLLITDEFSKNAISRIEKVVMDSFGGPLRLLKLYQSYDMYLSYNIEEYAESFMNRNLELKDFKQEVEKFYMAAHAIENRSLDEVSFDLIRVDCSSVKQTLVEKTIGTVNALFSRLARKCSTQCKSISDSFQVIYEKIQIEPQNAEELDELKRYVINCTSDITKLQKDFENVKMEVDILNSFSFNLPPEHFAAFVDTYSWPKKVTEVLEDIKVNLEEDRRKFAEDLTDSLVQLHQDIENFSKQLSDFSTFDEKGDVEQAIEKYYARILEMSNSIQQAKEKAQLYNNREKMFNFARTEFGALNQLSKDFEPINELWTIAYKESQEYDVWLNGPFQDLDPENVESNTNTWFKSLSTLERKITDPGPKKKCELLKNKFHDFKKHIPLIKALRNNGLRDRHMKKISALIGEELKITSSLKLSDLIDMNLGKYLSDIQEISDYASREYAIEMKLEKMESEWKSVEFNLAPQSKTWKLVELDEIQTLLDDQISATQSMRASPYVKEVELGVMTWEKKLLDLQELLDEWTKCQIAWLYLEPIFTSQDIATRLAPEATKFSICDKIWRTFMDMTQKTRNVMQVGSYEKGKSEFQRANQLFEEIYKNLRDYLETKRKAFPRFYFLSDDELLEILSETKDPLRVQKYLKQCFEGIDKLEFTEDLDIIGMMSEEGERIDFPIPISPLTYSGKVELWLLEVERLMRESVRSQIEQSINAYSITERAKWILEWPGQVIICVSQLYWTREVEQILSSNQGGKGLKRYETKLANQLRAIVELVRGDLTDLQRITLGALVVIDVHAKDVIRELRSSNVSDVADFDWQSQLRYYWEHDNMIVRQVTAAIDYGYEYLGNSGRLVITPLTDRCYRTLMGALQLSKGGAPEGPAGTGKTETTKDLAKAIAKQCIVFNCVRDDTTITLFDGWGYNIKEIYDYLEMNNFPLCFDKEGVYDLSATSITVKSNMTCEGSIAHKSENRKEADRFEKSNVLNSEKYSNIPHPTSPMAIICHEGRCVFREISLIDGTKFAVTNDHKLYVVTKENKFLWKRAEDIDIDRDRIVCGEPPLRLHCPPLELLLSKSRIESIFVDSPAERNISSMEMEILSTLKKSLPIYICDIQRCCALARIYGFVLCDRLLSLSAAENYEYVIAVSDMQDVRDIIRDISLIINDSTPNEYITQFSETDQDILRYTVKLPLQLVYLLKYCMCDNDIDTCAIYPAIVDSRHEWLKSAFLSGFWGRNSYSIDGEKNTDESYPRPFICELRKNTLSKSRDVFYNVTKIMRDIGFTVDIDETLTNSSLSKIKIQASSIDYAKYQTHMRISYCARKRSELMIHLSYLRYQEFIGQMVCVKQMLDRSGDVQNEISTVNRLCIDNIKDYENFTKCDSYSYIAVPIFNVKLEENNNSYDLVLDTTENLKNFEANGAVVHNCSDSLDHHAMAKFFKGLASSGAWSCFDEFNRIELEVLSVIAQQIQLIQQAVEAKKERFIFDGEELEIKSTCAIFITMNPGYAGRSELPDNLKALFRPVAMMIPDYALIAEISLFSCGFTSGRDLAKKIVATYKLCSEQLSYQDHYDYGMRAVKAVLNRAGSLKREFPNTDENILVLRAINDVNLPKFLAQDIPLFEGIISDLFPKVVLPPPDYTKLIDSINLACKKKKLQATEVFVKKILQLYEMIIVRHGLMLVGFSFSGKTSSYRILADALNIMSKDGFENSVKMKIINPKSITMGQLYGKNDEATKEWKDGIIAIHFRTFRNEQKTIRKWLVFDGPVDAIWIESMNTVLDDNKKLCLPNGETILMANNMNLVFEVQDLAVASPATVSRCGMVYLEPNSLGWEVLVKSWVEEHMPEGIQDEQSVTLFMKLVELFIPKMLNFVRKSCKEYVTTSNSMLVKSFLSLFQSMLDEFRNENTYKDYKERDKVAFIESIFIFSLIWSMGATGDELSREKFDAELKNLITNYSTSKEANTKYKFVAPVPDKNTVYDYSFDKNKFTWVNWMDTINITPIPEDASFQDIIVPTVDTTRYTFLLDTLFKHNKNVLFVGPTGTGKTVYIKQKLLNGMDGEKYIPIFVNFSARTSANQTQRIIEAKLEKRRRGQIGAPVGKHAIVFVDDLNLPQLEKYGAQPPIELLRQWMDHGGWYNIHDKELPFIEILDVQFACAMGPAGGGRNPVTFRYLRHFNLITLTPFDNKTLSVIFQEIMDWFLKGTTLMGASKQIVLASIEIYNEIIRIFKPTPTKSHYTFNLRDLSKVFQGIVSVQKSGIASVNELTRLWCHESMRVFQDRLVSNEDREKFLNLQKKFIKDKLKLDVNEVLHKDLILFGDFMDTNPDTRVYEELPDIDKVTKTVMNYLTEYNNYKRPMNLVLFNFAIEHIARISRIIKQPYGNALLIGVGGSGRQSLTKLATFVADYTLFEIVLTRNFGIQDWKESMKLMLKQCGIKGEHTVFLFTDSQIKEESFLEDISSLLNTGEIPNLFEDDEVKEIAENMRSLARQLNRDQSSVGLYNLFVERCRKHLHIVVCMSPIGDTLRNYLRMFPSLVNCCTIDWFSEWPEEALTSVAENFMQDVALPDDAIKQSCVKCYSYFHKTVEELSTKFHERMKRYNYVTPTSYLELLETFKNLYTKYKEELEEKKLKYDSGLENIYKTEEDVKKMQKELEILKPELERLSKETEDLAKKIEKEAEEANEARKIVESEEQVLNKQNEENKKIKDECESKLKQALPKLHAATDALKQLNPKDIVFVKSLLQPPNGVKLVMEGVCIIKGIAPKKVTVGNLGQKKDDYWEPAKRLMGERGFLNSLIGFDLDNSMTDEIQAKLQPLLKRQDFNLEAIKTASSAAYGMAKWIVALDSYHDIRKVVKPKEEALKQAEESYTQSMKQLDEKKSQMKELQDRLESLESNLMKYQQEKAKYESDYKNVNVKLERAKKLVSQLGGEKSRWADTSKELSVKYENLIGDILLSAATISYLGSFIHSYRIEIINQWKQFLKEHNIKFSDPYSLQTVCATPVQIREWQIQGLPADSFSTDNAVIVQNSRRWPLFIDPQGQASNWIKNKEKSSGYVVMKMSDTNLIKSLEKAIQLGTAAIIENIGEEIDPSLEPLLLKQVYRIAGQLSIKLSENPVNYHENFRFYMITSLSNPHYLPEVSTKVTLVNFMITPRGLEDQLLGIVVANEEKQLEDAKNQIVVQNAANEAKLDQIENEILQLLHFSKDKILEDDKAIQVLTTSKQTSNRIKVKQEEAKVTETQIDASRNRYTAVAQNAATLFFCINDLANIDPMYQFSLKWYKDLFVKCIVETKLGGDRILNLIDSFRYSLYKNVCRSLFEKDKLLFPFLMVIKLKESKSELNYDEWRFLLTGGIDVEETQNPAKEWLPEKSWNEICMLSKISAFKGFVHDFTKNLSQWKQIYDSATPHLLSYPGEWDLMNRFQKMLILRAIRPDKIIPAIQDFISQELDKRFVDPPPFDLAESFNESSCTKPLIFILSPGVDPILSLTKFAASKNILLDSLSLGQGQDTAATEKINKGVVKGSWVVLQNCHLFSSWMPKLEKLTEDFTSGKTAEHFRLWLTSMPSDKFPVSILQNGVKMTNEPPKGLRANLKSSWLSDPISDSNFFSSCTKPREFKKLLFGLTFFHAIVQERRKYGPLGWNIPYEYNESDLRISIQQLNLFLNAYSYVPFKALTYLSGHCNYGGRVTDDQDRKTLMAIMMDFYNEDILKDGYTITSKYPVPSDMDYEEYIQYINKLPMHQEPEVFGLHENADITKDQAEAMTLFTSALATQEGGSSEGGKSIEEIILEQSESILSKLPKNFNIDEASAKYPVEYSESMNTVLVQELVRYNSLLNEIRDSISNIIKAIKGEIVMSAELEKVGRSVFEGKIPEKWKSKSYPSLKPLGSYISDLLKRIEFFSNWLLYGPPTVYWISGFFFTQSFLTGTKQNYARKNKVAIDLVDFDFEVMDHKPNSPPKTGCYVNGLFLEGARWSATLRKLVDPEPKKLYDTMPVIWLKPVEKENIKTTQEKYYSCPMYKTSERKGTLSTTGHSTNYVMSIQLPIEEKEQFWLKRGCALLCQLN